MISRLLRGVWCFFSSLLWLSLAGCGEEWALYESDKYPFSMQYPASWTVEAFNPDIALSVSGQRGKNLYIYELDMEWAGCANLSECVQAFIYDLPTADSFIDGTEVQSITEQGLTVEIWENNEDHFYYRTLFYLNEDYILFAAVYETDKAESTAELAKQSHSTFQVKGK
ncbi:MAG: hypothetical protein OXI16_11885 [Chloroflexota bacterium]|nr:hypothetical protein [Chloroflexota bacterium]